ncbi:(Fe-S)-binding protein [Guyparkeria sp.]|uniref:(Fe-S)-binding protein n=1 Tax=Guyparkeria sp. TaxID=2035736 RepID=UPI003569D445
MTIPVRRCNLPDMPADSPRQLPELDAAIRDDALDCVMCGICVPHCPTFSITENEADGPRGRISILLGVSQGELSVDESVRDHLDGCLTCRACEVVCPSGVAFGRLIDSGRERLARESATALQPRALARPFRWLRDGVLARRRVMGAAWQGYRALHALGLGGVARRLSGRLGAALPKRPPAPLATSSRPAGAGDGATRGTIGLFIGCTGEAMNANTAGAAEQVLAALGYRVVIPREQVCCGAMHAHGGEPGPAEALRDRNARAFLDAGVRDVVVLGTACRSELAALESKHDIRVREVTEWLLETDPADWPAMQTPNWRIAVHTPCSQRNHLGQPGATRALLERIPGLELVEIDGNERCCGAAGMHVLLYPEQARSLRAPKIDSIADLQPDFVVSANVGCATHLAGGTDVPVIQPVELLAAAFERSRNGSN